MAGNDRVRSQARFLGPQIPAELVLDAPRSGAASLSERVPMTDDRSPETDEHILIFNVSDDELERAAAVTDGRVTTMIYCTQDLSCGDV